MSNPFHDLADQYDELSGQLRTLGDDWGTGRLTVGEPVEEPPPTKTETKSK